MNIRTKLIIGLTTLCGVFGGTAFLFYGQTDIFDDSVHDLSDFTQNHLQQNLDSLHLGAQLTSTLNQITNNLSTTNGDLDTENVVSQLDALHVQEIQFLAVLAGESYVGSANFQAELDPEAAHGQDDVHKTERHHHRGLGRHTGQGHDFVHTVVDPAIAIALETESKQLQQDVANFTSVVTAAIAAAEAGDITTLTRHRQEAITIAKTLNSTLLAMESNLNAQALDTVGHMEGFIGNFDQSIHVFSRLFWVSGLGGLGILLGISLWLIRSIDYPLRQLKNAARRNEKDRWHRAPVINKTDEIGQVAIAFNNMVQRIQNSQKELQEQVLALELSETKLIEAKSNAEEANIAKSRFLANMSHELRTPLNGIIGFSEMMRDEAKFRGDDVLIPDLAKINAAGQHLLGLINDILDISKIESGRMDLYLETFDINTMLQDVKTTITPLMGKNNNTLATDFPTDLGEMHSDVTKVRQNLFNLLSNAAKFTQKGTVTLRVKCGSDKTLGYSDGSGDNVKTIEALVFEVKDTGIGMSSEQLDKVFESFTQADLSTTRKYGGTGLGLTITRCFCQMMGGNITVNSLQGEGTTFTMTLPRFVAKPKKEEETSPPVVSNYQGNGTILVIDDDSSVGDYLKQSLTRYGLAVEVATSGAEGLEKVKTLKPSAITLDVMMPGMDGWAVLTALKKDPETAPIPVIMLTVINDKHLAYALGASDYLFKPVNRDLLLSTLNRFRNRDQGNSILIVDDNAMNRDVLRRQIEQEGWRVEEAHHGQQALDLMAIHTPSLILLDLMMPEMDGFQFIETLKNRAEWRSIPVVVVTAKDLTECDRDRLNGYIETIYRKGSYDRQTLVNEVQRLLQNALPALPATPPT